VSGVSFHISPGETFALVGESGSGKTTVARCVLGLVPVTGGSIDFRGTRISVLGRGKLRPLRRHYQAVFQDPYDSLDPRMTVGATIEEPLLQIPEFSQGDRRLRVRELLDLVRLGSDQADRYPHQLSGGQQQRVAIARAIATKPQLVVLDEPTSNLDISIRAQMMHLLETLQQDVGLSYLFISHDLLAVRHISHRIAIMYLGEIVETGTTEEVFGRQLHPYGRALLSSVLYPDPYQVRSSFLVKGEIPSPVDLPTGCYLASRCPTAIEACRLQHPELLSVTPTHEVRCSRVVDGVPPWEQAAEAQEAPAIPGSVSQEEAIQGASESWALRALDAALAINE
jgi:oligopeptide/dipeptide ABC transporter ATP-binding protein